MSKFCILSDLHLNHSQFSSDLKGADYLLLAGDLSPHLDEIVDWVERQVPVGLPTFFVPGNHEYEYQNIETYDQTLKESFSHLPHVHVLNNDTYFDPDRRLRIVGSTLWSEFEAYAHRISPEAAKAVCSILPDFKRIHKSNGEAFTPMDAARLSRQSKRYLQSVLDEPFDGFTLVMTHFLPSIACVSRKHRESPFNPYFATDAESLLLKSDLWVHGHTHESVDFCFDLEAMSRRVICNPRGYSKTYNLSENPDFNPVLMVEVPLSDYAIRHKITRLYV